MICNEKPREGLNLINQADFINAPPGDLICLAATAGLAYFKLGQKVEGIAHYNAAIEGARRRNMHDLRVRAELYLAREMVLSGDSTSKINLMEAISAGKLIKNSDTCAVATRIEEEMFPLDTEQSKDKESP